LLAAIIEDLPEEHNRVSLDPELKDSHGIAAPKVSYRLSENSARMIEHAVANGEKVMRAAGAHTVMSTPLLRGGGWHLMGTARMGSDRKRSVVDRNGQAHDVDNLFIVDGSVFVTGGCRQSHPTIQAVALRVADHIRGARADLRSA
jgi:choline dehydrogenase-like flavoprotein